MNRGRDLLTQAPFAASKQSVQTFRVPSRPGTEYSTTSLSSVAPVEIHPHEIHIADIDSLPRTRCVEILDT